MAPALGGSRLLLLMVTATTMMTTLVVRVRPQGLDLADALDGAADVQATPAPLPGTKPPVKAKGKEAGADGFDLADALDPDNDLPDQREGGRAGGGFSDADLIDVSNDDSYKPDRGKGGRPGGGQDRPDRRGDGGGAETTAEVGTIAGIVSAVGMALVGAVSSYISYQKKKLCFSIQQNLNAEMVKADAPDGVLATEPQVQQTLLEQTAAEPGRRRDAV